MKTDWEWWFDRTPEDRLRLIQIVRAIDGPDDGSCTLCGCIPTLPANLCRECAGAPPIRNAVRQGTIAGAWKAYCKNYAPIDPRNREWEAFKFGFDAGIGYNPDGVFR